MNIFKIVIPSILVLSVVCQCALAGNSLVGTNIKIEHQGGNVYIGKLISTSRDSIELIQSGDSKLSFGINDIGRAYQRQPSTMTGLTVGAFTGLAAAFIINVVRTNNGSDFSIFFDYKSDKTVLGDVVDFIIITCGGAALGATIGAVIYTYRPIEVESLSISASSDISRDKMETGVKICFHF